MKKCIHFKSAYIKKCIHKNHQSAYINKMYALFFLSNFRNNHVEMYALFFKSILTFNKMCTHSAKCSLPANLQCFSNQTGCVRAVPILLIRTNLLVQGSDPRMSVCGVFYHQNVQDHHCFQLAEALCVGDPSQLLRKYTKMYRNNALWALWRGSITEAPSYANHQTERMNRPCLRYTMWRLCWLMLYLQMCDINPLRSFEYAFSNEARQASTSKLKKSQLWTRRRIFKNLLCASYLKVSVHFKLGRCEYALIRALKVPVRYQMHHSKQ